MAPPAVQPAGPAAGRSAAGNGSRVDTHRCRLHGRRSGRIPRHIRLRYGCLPGRCFGWRLRPPRRAPGQRFTELQQHGVWRRPSHGHLCRRECWRWLRHLWPVRGGAGGSARVVRGSSDGCPGRSHHRFARAQEFRAEASRAAHLVGCARRLRRLHPLRRPLQRLQSGRPAFFLPSMMMKQQPKQPQQPQQQQTQPSQLDKWLRRAKPGWCQPKQNPKKPEKTRKNPKKPEKTRQISPSSPTPAARRFPKRPLDGGSAAQSRSLWLDGGSAAQSRSPSLDGGTAARWGFLSANDGALFLSWPLDGAAQAFPIPTRHRWEPVLKPFSLSYSFSFELKNGICTFSSSLCKIGGMFSFFLSGFVLFDLIC